MFGGCLKLQQPLFITALPSRIVSWAGVCKYSLALGGKPAWTLIHKKFSDKMLLLLAIRRTLCGQGLKLFQVSNFKQSQIPNVIRLFNLSNLIQKLAEAFLRLLYAIYIALPKRSKAVLYWFCCLQWNAFSVQYLKWRAIKNDLQKEYICTFCTILGVNGE